MSRALARRISKLEDRRRVPVRVPHVVELRHGETADEAWARFKHRYAGHVRPRHAVLFVPTWPTIDAFAASLKPQQMALHAWVREHHPKEPASC